MPHIRFADDDGSNPEDDQGMDLEMPREEDPASTAMAAAVHPSFLPPSSSPSFPLPCPSPSPSPSLSASTFRPSDGAQALHAVKTIQTAYGPSDDPTYVFDLACNGDGSLLAASLSTHEIKIYTYASGDFLSTLHGHEGTITDLCFPDPGNLHMLASCASDGTVRLWDTRSNQQCLQWTAEGKEEFESLSFGGTTGNLLVAGANAKVIFWDTRSRKTVACLEECHMEPVTQVKTNQGGSPHNRT
ncbi:hypothetical protein CBR_g34279 [Chara braunii]|uniref:Uncharacterized protein n=1 Tax=Chara braunii TaxID=69332 RepID=A0A388JYQ9_CHABU|nr:hypothetical protein CBR_g34279 [Chara braunii]|eukprot:GBG62907.1 hypothetical protein CBR_g34279 [Chara braunii]